MFLDELTLHDLVRGAAFLGTGGGGDPYIGRVMVEEAMRAGKRVELIDPEDVPDDALVIPTAMMGAPTVIVEKLPCGTEACQSLRVLEQHVGRKAYATMPIECGGINSTIPLLVGATLGLPVVNADGMGRAFPELYMETFHVYGVAGTPMVISNEYGDSVLVTTHDNYAMEWFARGITIRMGGCAYIAEYAMDGATVRRTAVPHTLSLCIRIGQTLRHARAGHRDPFEALALTLKDTPYRHAHVLFEGRVTSVQRATVGGFARGECIIQAAGSDGERLRIEFQNENLVALKDDQVAAIVPDLICVLDADTAEPITTEYLRYGLFVKVMVVSTPDLMRTPEALRVFGPQAFGLPYAFQPVEAVARS